MPEQKTTTKKATETPEYTKQNLVTSTVFTVTERDILNIVLEDDKNYTLAEARAEIKKFKGGF